VSKRTPNEQKRMPNAAADDKLSEAPGQAPARS
jgi:hypothetical protein